MYPSLGIPWVYICNGILIQISLQTQNFRCILQQQARLSSLGSSSSVPDGGEDASSPVAGPGAAGVTRVVGEAENGEGAAADVL